MLDLSPTKLLIIFVVAVVLLGPQRLPQLARQLGAGWHRLRDWHAKVDREVRQAVPDLPSSGDLVRFARSPVSLLNQLADHSAGRTDGPAAGRSATASEAEGEDARDGGLRAGEAADDRWPPVPAPIADDPSLN